MMPRLFALSKRLDSSRSEVQARGTSDTLGDQATSAVLAAEAMKAMTSKRLSRMSR